MISVPTWVLTGIVAVCARAVMSPYQKQLLADASESEVLFVRDTVALGLFLPVIGWTALQYGFTGTPRSTVAMVLTGVLNVIGAFMIFAALSREDASVIIPLTSLSPIITSLVEPVLRDTSITPFVIAGAVLSAFGAAIVNSEQNTLQSVLHGSDTTAVVLAVSVNFIFGITSTLDGIATATINPVYVSAIIVLFVGIGSAGRLWRAGVVHEASQRRQLLALYRGDKGVLGVLQFGGLAATLFTFGAAPSATQASILFRASIILVVIISSIGLKEGHLRRRAVGAVLIALGVGLGVSG
ncbi:DMT family transporter [Haloquadratum walsbyi]|jgi:EamA-like transporter family.|uniref:Putative membrane protein n=1 Tax=Haloquadratum walsbyi J07HQW2 TaxID=1238425 RepID=U1PUW5_9EURY|nr:DMT family transporter [Haloquadratum walsbyi]ERG96181.1 MAG: putative membrane protein [Haloquadratum walsbyi J07HQW2]